MTYIPEANNTISTVNSRDASTFEPFEVFQGTVEDVSAYARVGISVRSDNKSDGILTIEVSHDGVIWGGPERNWEDTRFAEPHMWTIVEQYFRIKYTNGTTLANNLSIQVQYSTNSDILLGHQLNKDLVDETEGIVTKSVIVGQDERGIYQNVPVDNRGNLKVKQESSETTNILEEILNELRVSNAYNSLLHGITINIEDI